VVSDEELRLNHIQVIGSHNSYHLAPEPTLFAGIEAVSAELARDIEYSHVSLTEQLDEFGIRQFELDVFADPGGGLYANRAANEVVGLPSASGEPALDEPGFKVLHTQDFDYGTTCFTFVACLSEIKAWSADHPDHLPIMILVELKDESVVDAAAESGVEITIELPWAIPVETDVTVMAALDTEIRSVFEPDQLIEPDDVRGDAKTLSEAIENDGWPSVDDARGQVMLTLNGGGSQREIYTADAPALEGRAMFTSSEPGAPDGAFVQIPDPTDPRVVEVAEAGYLIRTRTDVPTLDARNDDTTRRDAALTSGAHFLSTDYYEPSEFFESSYVVAFPDGAVAVCNPLTAPTTCSADQLTER
jgi:hypothetical protein